MYGQNIQYKAKSLVKKKLSFTFDWSKNYKLVIY